MLCVSVAEPTIDRCRARLRRVSFGEVRLEALRSGTDRIGELAGGPTPVIAACRPGRLAQAERRRRLLAAIEGGAAFVDIEVDAPARLREEVVFRARRVGCGLIISFHDPVRTPSRARLERLVARCFAAGADWAKIACRVASRGDTARLLGLLDGGGVVVVGMGPKGRAVRLLAPLLGSPWSYVHAVGARPTAPGQLDAASHARAARRLERLLEEG